MKLSTFNFQFSTLLLAAFLCFQSVSAQTSAISDEARKEIREKIGLDMTVPDFSTKKIDAKVMGTRLAGILEYQLENFHQDIYERYYAKILSEQHEALHNKYFDIKKMKFISASKKDNEITILMKVWPDKNTANVKQADLKIHFIDGVSESRTTNELFSTLSRYVQARENFNQ